MEKKQNLTTSYFIKTALFMLLMPNIIFLAAFLLWAFFGNFGEINLIAILIFIALSLLLAAFYGENKTVSTPSKPKKLPKTLLWLYFPVFLPVMWHFIMAVAIFFGPENSRHYEYAPLLNGLICISFPGAFLADMIGVCAPLGCLIYDLVPIVGFTVGERISANKNNIKRSTSKKVVAVFSGAMAAVIAVSLLSDNYRNMLTVEYISDESDGAGYTSGYNFPFEYGWSSVDLRPYYVENPDNRLAKISDPSFTVLEQSKMPVLDGAEAAYPIYSAFANCCYENIASIQVKEKEKYDRNAGEKYDYSVENIPDTMPVRFSNTIEAFKGLVDGKVDIFFGARPSDSQKKLAEAAGKELVLTPIGKEAFVFFVSEENPVDGLTSEQIRKIYSGEYKNWLQAGGGFSPILAFQRPENSGSQTMMQYFMGDVPLKEPLTVEYVGGMLGALKKVASYQNKSSSIGYSFRYYAQQMSGGNVGIKLLALDGVYPSEENISSGDYPMTTELYAITLKDNPNENVAKMLDWMIGSQGQEIVGKTGYVKLPMTG